ncbi:MAG: TetR/AcrR family transcriptional regulator C-terminal domain-containing protein, partial [Candidatus Binataceae bacterium]
GQTFYEHGPARSYQNFADYLRYQTAAGTLTIADVRLAADLFFGTLLHRRVLTRIYGVEPPPQDIEEIARVGVTEFLNIYANPDAGPQRRRLIA